MKPKKFADLPITNKLRRLQTLTVGLALLFVLCINIATQLWHERRQMLDDVSSTGKMIGYNVSAALLFNDSSSATEVLAALRSKINISAARIYTKEGVPYAQFIADKQTPALPENLFAAEQHTQHQQRLLLSHSVIQPIQQDTEVLGYLYLVINLRPMMLELMNNLGQISLVMLAAFLLSLLLGQRLAAFISTPLIHLAQMARQVSREKNYTLRASGEGEGEIGQLVVSFNQMIEQVQQRDSELASHRDLLEHEVETRTVELRMAVAEAQAASLAKSQFLATMSHEIRTPMNGVLGMAELLLGTSLTPTQQRFAEMVQKSGESLLTIINDILDFSKIEAGYFELENLEFNLYQTIEDVVELFAEQAHNKDLGLGYRVATDVPINVKGDPTRIRQILGNLVSNAIKFTEYGKILIDVCLDDATTISALPTDNPSFLVRFAVRDTGIGIRAEVVPRLFQSFSQADSSTTRKYGGTGLGLAISRQLTELMGGEISVSTKIGLGSTFTFTLPLLATSPALSNKPADEYVNAVVNAEATAVAGTETASFPRILLAEDNLVNQELTMFMLQQNGYSLDIVNNGREAIQAVELKTYDLVLMDCMMPEIDGYEATAEIRRRQKSGILPPFPIIALTANVIEGDREKCLNGGMDDYLSKPFKTASLLKIISLWLNSGSQLLMPTLSTSKKAISSTIINEAALDIIRKLDPIGEDNLLQHMIGLYLRNAEALMLKLEGAWTEGAIDAIRSVSHTLKSSSSQIGADDLANLCCEVENQARNQEYDVTGMAFSRLKLELNQARAALQQYLD